MYREPTRGHQWRAYPRSLPPSTTPVVVDWLSTLIKRGWGLPPRQRLCVVAIALAVVTILATTFLVQLIIVAVVASFLALRELIITTSIVPWQQRIRFCDESKDLLDRVILIEDLRKKGWNGRPPLSDKKVHRLAARVEDLRSDHYATVGTLRRFADEVKEATRVSLS